VRKPLALAPLVLVAVIWGVLESSGTAERSPTPSYPARGSSAWARAATDACTFMQDRMSRQGPAFFGPINANRPLPKVAAARRTWLAIHEDALRRLRSAAPARTPAQRHALVVYEQMLAAIRAVIPPAARNDRAAYNRANIRMVLSIVATRKAFDRLGAGHICDFGI
jgi:hypothetical protein